MQCIETNKNKDTHKIHVPMPDVQQFWQHWNDHDLPHHPAAEEAKSNDGVLRFPVGVSGDDARYTLAGSKFLVVMISSVLYKVKRFQVANATLYMFFFKMPVF